MGSFLVLSCSLGCAKNYGFVRYATDVYPEKLEKNAPLVLAIPGLNMPGLSIPQDQHFGNLVEMLAEHGIPAKILAYDTPEHPLTAVANLADDQTNIAATRVGPAVIDAILREKANRREHHLPPLKEVVFFSYSQGGVIAQRIAKEIYLFKCSYSGFCRKYGMEWTALQKDPEFIYLMNAILDYMVIKNIKVQRESDFQSDPDLRNFYRRARRKLHDQAKEFALYLKNPSKKYPDVLNFDPPGTGKYPKRYPRFSAWVSKCLGNTKEQNALEKFFVRYAALRRVMDLQFRFISTAGSFFGSPRADSAYALFQTIPILRPIAGPELEQIRDTRLGSAHQIKEAQELLELKRLNRYPFSEKDTLFIVGVNGDKGDGMVDQSSAHLTNHALGHIKIAPKISSEKRFSIVVDRLPDLVVVPLPLKHLPEENFFGHDYGAAYMEKDNPVFPYLVAFVNKDWSSIENLLTKSTLKLQQFMVILSFKNPRRLKEFAIVKKTISGNIRVDSQYTNPDTHTIVWTGHFVGKHQHMNPLKTEDDSGFIMAEISTGDGSRAKDTADIPVFPGCNTFIQINTE